MDDLLYANLCNYNINDFVLCSLYPGESEAQFKSFLGSFTLKYKLRRESLKRKMKTQ